MIDEHLEKLLLAQTVFERSKMRDVFPDHLLDREFQLDMDARAEMVSGTECPFCLKIVDELCANCGLDAGCCAEFCDDPDFSSEKLLLEEVRA